MQGKEWRGTAMKKIKLKKQVLEGDRRRQQMQTEMTICRWRCKLIFRKEEDKINPSHIKCQEVGHGVGKVEH